MRSWQTFIAESIGFAATCLFHLASECYEKGSIILTNNKSYGDWGTIFADNVIASAILERLLHHSTTINIKGESYRLKDKKRPPRRKEHKRRRSDGRAQLRA